MIWTIRKWNSSPNIPKPLLSPGQWSIAIWQIGVVLAGVKPTAAIWSICSQAENTHRKTFWTGFEFERTEGFSNSWTIILSGSCKLFATGKAQQQRCARAAVAAAADEAQKEVKDGCQGHIAVGCRKWCQSYYHWNSTEIPLDTCGHSGS